MAKHTQEIYLNQTLIRISNNLYIKWIEQLSKIHTKQKRQRNKIWKCEYKKEGKDKREILDSKKKDFFDEEGKG